MLTLQEALIRHCMKLKYRMAILDTRDFLLPEQAAATCKKFQGTSYAALYYPWILVDDLLRLTGIARAVPPSGAIAGIYALTDRQFGVHKPPANTMIEGALEVHFAVDDIAHGELNDANVNVVRSVPGRGIRAYGAGTVSTDPLWRYINVRRLVAIIEKAIEHSSGIARAIRTYLEALFRRGMLDGADSGAVTT